MKSAFLNGFINEEVYVEQPLRFGSFNFPNHVFKLKKALYGLKQAPRAWYERLSKFLISSGFKMGKIDTTLFIKLRENDILIVQIYVDDIIFGATNVSLCEEFAKSMHSEFEMSMMGELNFFLGLQIKQLKEGTFINQAKYIKDLLKKFNLEEVKAKNTPMGSSIKFDMDEKGKSVDQTKYRGMIGSLLSPHHLILLYFTIISFSSFFIFTIICFILLFSLLGVMILRIFWYIEGSHITLFFIPSFDIDSVILA